MLQHWTTPFHMLELAMNDFAYQEVSGADMDLNLASSRMPTN